MALTKIKLNTMVTGTLPDANIPDDITIDTAAAAPANALTGNTLASGVTASSLTSVGTLTGLTTGAITQNAGTLTIKNASSDSNGLKIYQDSSDASKIYNHYNGTLELGVGSTTAITIDSSENTTFAGDISAGGNTLNTWNSLHSAVQLGYGAFAVRQNNNTTYLTNNIYYESSGSANPTYIHENEASALMCSDGKLFFFNAPSGTGTATLTKRLEIEADGTVVIPGALQPAGNITTSGNITTAEDKRISIGTWDNSGFTGSNAYGLSIDSELPIVHMSDTDTNKKAFFGLSGDNMYIGGNPVDDMIFQTGSGVERMRIASDGRVAIKATSLPEDFGSARGHLCISSTDDAAANNYAILELQGHTINNDGSLGAIHFYDHSSSNASIQVNRQNNSGSAKMMFSTSESGGAKKARMTIYDAGAVLIDNDNSGSPAQLTVQNDGSTGWLGTWLVLNSKNHSNRGAGVTMHNQAADKGFFTGCIYQSGFDKWSICFEGRNYADQTTADSDHEVLHVNYDGAAYNDQNTWGSSSDERIKNSIVDSNSQWDDIKSLKIKNYKLTKHGKDAPTLIGVIAQDLEKSGMNGLIDETEADELQIARYEDINKGDKIKSVKYSVLYMKAIKALQEAMEKIETLETKVEALEKA